MKKSKSRERGFTLIELMVVISIISLLSSVVLASVKSAREKAQITKTVAEMKSLQTAIELYRNQFEVYPQGTPKLFFGDGGVNFIENDFSDTLENVFQNTLISNKFISKIPHAPYYPNNCKTNCAENGYVLGYLSEYAVNINNYEGAGTYSVMCGKDKVKNYVIYFHANSKTVNLPKLEVYDSAENITYSLLEWFLGNTYSFGTYCIAG